MRGLNNNKKKKTSFDPEKIIIVLASHIKLS